MFNVSPLIRKFHSCSARAKRTLRLGKSSLKFVDLTVKFVFARAKRTLRQRKSSRTLTNFIAGMNERNNYVVSCKNVKNRSSGDAVVGISLSKLKISNRSYYYMAVEPVLWNSLPAHLRQPASPSSDISGQNSTLALSRNSFLSQFLFKFSHPP